MIDYHPKQTWQFAGFATPESTLESWSWARSRADQTAMLRCRTPEVQKILQREFTVISEKEFMARTDRLFAKINGYRIVKRESVSTEEVILHVAEMSGADEGESGMIVFKKCDAEWKMSESKRD